VFASAAVRPLRAARANRVFGADEKRIRTKTTVMDKSKGGFASVLIQDPARQLRIF